MFLLPEKRKYFLFLLACLLLLAGCDLYRNADPEEQVKAANALPHPSTFDEFLGVNSIREQNPDKILTDFSAANYHRVFSMHSRFFTGEEIVTRFEHPYAYIDKSIPHDEYPDDRMGFSPSRGAGGFDFDLFLKRMNEAGYGVIPVLADNLLYTNVQGDSVINMTQLPWDDGGDRENPMDYKAYSSFLYQFTARYGNNKFSGDGGTLDSGTLKLMPDNDAFAGLGLVEAIEPGNEMDRDWFTSKEEASARDMAAFLSAAIDGHMGRMGPGHGIRQADSDMKIVFPSPIEIRPDYILEVREELMEMRAKAPSFDYEINPLTNFIISAHVYPKAGDHLTDGRPMPEATDIFERSVDFVKLMRKTFPGCDVMLTETGYDKVIYPVGQAGIMTAPDDPLTDDVSSPYAQAKFLTRSLFLYFAAGYDRTYLFTLTDPAPSDSPDYGVPHLSSGLIRRDGHRELMWNITKQLQQRLHGYEFGWYKVSEDLHQLLLKKDNEENILVAWVGTNEGQKRLLTLKASNGSIMHLENSGDADGNISKLTDDHVTIGEFPSLIIGFEGYK